MPTVSRLGTSLALALSFLAASALAAGLKTASETKNVGVEEVKTAAAKCKPKSRAVSGGFKLEFDPDQIVNPDLLLTSTRRAGARRWAATAGNGGSPGDLTSYAYCGARKLRRAAVTEPIPAGATPTVTARCPSGATALSGGYRASPIDFVADTTPVMQISANRRGGSRSWRVSVFNNGSEGGALTVYAYCRSGKATTLRRKRRALDDAGGADVSAIRPKCRRRERAVAGGYASPEPGKGAAAVVGSRKRGGRTWLVQARTGQTGAPVTVTAYVYCEAR